MQGPQQHQERLARVHTHPQENPPTTPHRLARALKLITQPHQALAQPCAARAQRLEKP